MTSKSFIELEEPLTTRQKQFMEFLEETTKKVDEQWSEEKKREYATLFDHAKIIKDTEYDEG